MKLSIVVATNKATYWARFCEALAKNDAQMEVIFVGPVGSLLANLLSSASGNVSLAVPTRFIDIWDPAVGAARCWEIGARAATGELLGLAPDDCVYSPGFLDAVVAAASLPHNPYDMFTAHYFHNGNDGLSNQHMWSIPEMPLQPVAGFAFTEDHHRIGGIDKRFHGVFWDADLYLHMYQLGGRTTLLGDHICHEQNADHSLYGHNNGADAVVLQSLWPAPVHPGMQRASERQRWEDL
jgi:hypothetical protein